MKRIIAVLLVILSVSLVFCSCGKSEQAKAVEEQINSIGEVNLEKGSLIEDAEKAYALLSGEDKGDVKNYEKLAELKAQYKALSEYNEKAQSLIGVYNRIFTEYGIGYAEVTVPFEELKAAIPEDNEALKAEYEKIFATVSEKNDKFVEIGKAAVASSVSYINGYKKLNGITELEIKEIGCIAQISDETSYFLFAMVCEDSTGEKSVYSTARFTGTPSVESMMAYKDNFYTDAPASEKTDALKRGNVVFDLNEVSEALGK